jgi:pimeloyl-ACP methyl ester carboxylesterase
VPVLSPYIKEFVMREGWFEGHDGTRLWYRTVGKGNPIILCDGIGCSGYAWRYLIDYFQDTHQIIHWNYKGHGKSDLPLTYNHLGIADLARDMNALCEHLNLDPVVAIGHSMGVQVVLEFGHLFPERTAGIVPVCGSYGNPLDTFHDNKMLKTVFPLLRKAVNYKPSVSQTIWELLLRTELSYQIGLNFEVNPRLVKREDFQDYFTDLSRVDATLFVEMLSRAQEHNAKPYLKDIPAPTLIVGGERDNFTPMWLSREMQRGLPNAELLIVPEGSHTAPIELPELIHLRIEKFLREKVWPPTAKQVAQAAAPDKKAAIPQTSAKPKTQKKATPKKSPAKKKAAPKSQNETSSSVG